MKRLLKGAAFVALLLPLIGATCTEEKVVEIIIGVPTTATFIAQGELNTHNDSDTVDVKGDLDLDSAIDDSGIDPDEVSKIEVQEVCYRIVTPEGGRTIQNGELTVERVGAGAPAIAATGFSADCSVATDWISISDKIGPAGLALVNTFLNECLQELKGGPAVTNGVFTYTVSGDSFPQDVETNFVWEIKLTIKVYAAPTYEVPFG